MMEKPVRVQAFGRSSTEIPLLRIGTSSFLRIERS
jgi:hypothetical protein